MEMLVDLASLFCAPATDLQSFNLAEPAFALGFGDTSDEVVANLDQSSSLIRIRSEQ
ncbi:hypothetical protein [Streptomyces sp. NPDC056192]|uniref:hypothetical protein n=1 Tax=Streptomyces sp. NPDC056192 TaxID=3345743 RepID=UPI0035E17861